MYILLVCILAPLVQNGLSLNGEEIDLKSLSNYETADDISDSLDIWDTAADESDAGFVVFDSISDELLEKICKDAKTLVYITEEDVTIDCAAFKNDGPVNNKVVKREAEVEGSGDAEEENKEEETKDSEENQPSAVVGSEDSPTSQPEVKEEEAPPKSEDNQPPVVTESEESQTSQPEAKEEEAPPKPEDNQPPVVTESEESQTSQPEAKEEEEAPPKPEDNQPPAVAGNEESQTSPPETKEDEAPEENQPQAVAESGDETTTVQSSDETVTKEDKLQENPVEEEQETTTSEPSETTQKSVDEILTGDENEVLPKEEKPLEAQNEDKTEQENETAPKEAEEKEQATEGFKPKSDDHDPKKDAEIIKGKTLLGQQNQETKVSANDVKTDESTQDTKKAGTKDTTILVFLFVAVLVVGALAFGYNFIKKRKQRAADLERVERAPSVKRSLQDLVKAENEQEKKPLMGDKEVEMVDMKKENNTHEVTDKAPSEETVKS